MGYETVIACLCLMAVYPTSTSCEDPTHPGTTPHIGDIFMGRCYEYSEIQYKDLLPRATTSCASIFDRFISAFSYRGACHVSMELYDTFFDAAKQELPKDKVLFWSGVYRLAHQYAANGVRMITLEDTLIGYMVNSIIWCGQKEYPGINFESCPAWTDCPLEASESFWAGASKTFASLARGNVTLILDGSHPTRPAYRRDSFFGKYELPNLTKGSVSGVQVLIAHNLTTQVSDDCQSDSVQLLAADLSARGFQMTCEENPARILFLLCADDPLCRECLAMKNFMAGLLPRRNERTRLSNERPDDFM